MGLSDFFKSKPSKISKSSFDYVARDIGHQLKLLREQSIFGSVTGLASEYANIEGIVSHLEADSEIDHALKAYQIWEPSKRHTTWQRI